jgi:glycosyltransferase involved in cell wall biosynthesis
MKIILLANTDWYLYNFKMSLAQALRERGDSVLLISPAGKYTKKLVSQGFQWKELNFDRSGVNPFFETLTLFRLWKYYTAEQPDLVLHFTIKPVLYGSIIALLTSVPVIVNSITGRGYVFTGNANWLRILVSLLYRLVLRRTWTIFENPDDQSAFLNQKLIDDLKQTCLIRGAGVDTNRFQAVPEPTGVPMVILPARLLWDKGVGEFAEAASILKKRKVKARFILAGDTDPGNPSAVPLDCIYEWQKQNLLEWWGWQENMVETYHQSTLVCLPSFYPEGVPTCLIEAAACGRAIVTTNMPGCREIVRQDENGLLVPAQDATALANALQSLLENPSRRQKMAENGRRIAVNEFDTHYVIQSTLEFYERALTSRRGIHAL